MWGSNRQTDGWNYGRTDGPTDRRSDTPFYRDARRHLIRYTGWAETNGPTRRTYRRPYRRTDTTSFWDAQLHLKTKRQNFSYCGSRKRPWAVCDSENLLITRCTIFSFLFLLFSFFFSFLFFLSFSPNVRSSKKTQRRWMKGVRISGAKVERHGEKRTKPYTRGGGIGWRG